MKMIPVVFLLIPGVIGFKQNLEFLFPVGKTEIPTMANFTTYSYVYMFEKIKYDAHLAVLAMTEETLTKGAVFKDSNTFAAPLPQLAASILRTISTSREMIAELGRTCQEKQSYGTKSINDTTKNDPGVMGLINHMILLDYALGSFYRDVGDFISFLQGMKVKTTTEGMIAKLQRHFDASGEDVNVDLLTPTFFHSESEIITFEVRITTYGDQEVFLVHDLGSF